MHTQPLQELVVATGNQGKLKEISQLLSPLGWQVLPQSQFEVSEAAETGLTFVENALLKARNACQQTGRPALADDSGLQVDALAGKPGIYSARFAGENANDEDNNHKLLGLLANKPVAERGAQFVCAMVYLQQPEDPTPIICQGIWRGSIALSPAGDNGFGYDPLFFVTTENCTSAQLPAARKNLLSHRGQALKAMTEQLAALPTKG